MKQNAIETGFTNAAAASWIPPTATFAAPPSSPATGAVYVFTDALTAGAIVGGGTALSTCRWSGSAWVATGGSGSGGGGASGALVLLEQHTASNSASLDFTTCITSAYDEYQIELVNLVPATSGANGFFRMSTDGGASYVTGTSYAWATFGSSSASSSGPGGGESQAQLQIVAGLANTSNWSLVGTYRLFSPGGSGYKHMLGLCHVLSSDTHIWQVEGSGTFISTAAVNAIRFLFSSGNIVSGTIRVYGVAKTTVASPDFILVNGA